MTIGAVVETARARLIASGIAPEDAGLDAEVLARHLLGWDRATYFSERHRHIDRAFDGRYAELIARRAGREPVAHLTGHRDFWGLEFGVTPDVLIPRPETELVVEAALGLRIEPTDDVVVADVGTGSGCLTIALAVAWPAARIVATDVSLAALAVARTNAEGHGVADRISWRHGRGLAGLAAPVDLIVSNPPYIPASSIPELAPEVRDYEPRIALDGGTDGTAALRELAAEADAALAPDGALVVEFGCGQEAAVRRLVGPTRLTVIDVLRDLQGLPRVAVVQRRSVS